MSHKKIERKLESIRQQIAAIELVMAKFLGDYCELDSDSWVRDNLSRTKTMLLKKHDRLVSKLTQEYREANATAAAWFYEYLSATYEERKKREEADADYADEATSRYMQGLVDDEDDEES